MAVILAGVQLYSDLSPMLTGEKSLIGNDYMIISRPVERVGGETPKITAAEIEELRAEEFVENLGAFASFCTHSGKSLTAVVYNPRNICKCFNIVDI